MATGTATIDFGAYPGKLDASVAVTGQGSIVSGSLVEAWIRPIATAAHSIDEHIMANALIDVVAANIIAGTGFTIYAVVRNNNPQGGPAPVNGQFVPYPRPNTRMYGTFTIAWAWA